MKSGRIQWRLFEERDREAVAALHAQQEKLWAKPMDFPDLLSRPVLVAIVGEVNEVITNCVYLEAEAECCALGTNPLATNEMQGALDLLMPVVLGYQLHIVRCFVPALMVKKNERGKSGALARVLSAFGFRQEDSSVVSQFYKWV